MIITTTQSVDGKKIEKYLGLVTGADTYTIGGIIGEGLLKVDRYFEQTCERIRTKMVEKAERLRADAIIGVQMSVTTGGAGTGGQVYIAFTGTAVKLGEGDTDELPDL